jgi:hypothetical protein
MTPTLVDVHMLTSLDIIGSVNPFKLLNKPTFKLDSVRSGGWSNYINIHKSSKKSVNEREYVAFLNMWLDKYLFCGSTCGPTFKFLPLVEKLALGSEIPLGKLLLGSLYNLMNQVAQHLMKNEPVLTTNGPWWLLQLWLNLYLHNIVIQDIRSLNFPDLTIRRTRNIFGQEGQISPMHVLW